MTNNLSAVMVPLVSLMIGWMLNEYSHHIRARKLHRGALGKAVAELLEIRHQMLGVSIAMSHYKDKLTTNELVSPDVYNTMVGLLPDPDMIMKRYNAAIDIIAESDPILAYQLRSNDIVFNLAKIFSSINIHEGNVEKHLEAILSSVYGNLMSEFETSIKLVALKHSISTWLKVINLFKSNHVAAVAEKFNKEIKLDDKSSGT